MGYIKIILKLGILGTCFYVLSIISQYFDFSRMVEVTLNFAIAAIFSLIWAILPEFKKSNYYRLSREIDFYIQTLESQYKVYVANLEAQQKRRLSGGFTNPKLRDQFKYDNNKYLDQIKKLKDHINNLKSIFIASPKSKEFKKIRLKKFYINSLEEILNSLLIDNDLRESQAVEIDSLKEQTTMIMKELIGIHTEAFSGLYSRVSSMNLKKNYGILMPAIPRQMLYLNEKSLKELNEIVTKEHYNFKAIQKREKKIR